ncbi:MAG: L,D-transpeptidase family protein [Deltaproteobacteria bacterium]|nr:L,D-transpeptidase family protein [Deltaproteobacteria bacterium]
MKSMAITLFAIIALSACTSVRSPRDSKTSPRSETPVYPALSRSETFQTVQALWLLRNKARDDRQTRLGARLAKEPMFKKATKLTLETRGWDFFFSTPSGPASAVELLVEAVRDLPGQGMTTVKYPVESVEDASLGMAELADRLAQARVRLEASKAWSPLRGLVESDAPPTESAIRGLFEAGRLERLSSKDLGAVEEAFRRVLEKQLQLDDMRINLEVAASVAFFRYGLDMRFLKIASPFQADQDPSLADITHLDELVQSFEVFARDPREGLRALKPSHPYYDGLVAGLAAYRKMAEEGEFPKVPTRGKFRKGSKGKRVLALKTRLAREGYFQGDVTFDRFDEAFEDAVKAYQATHGFEITGHVEHWMLRSINVPIERRINQIELSLQRWRESAVRADEDIYIRVNIPEFMMEVWDQGERVLKHRVVVGNNVWDRDPDGGWEGRINRTKIFEAEIEQVVLNPRWYLPKRIRRLELDFEILSRPDYYLEHNYKVEVLPDGREKVYQDSGELNALGVVKFVFPNHFGIFMHDTPHKKFFERDIRAYSHGCIRLQDPMDVAYYLLKRCKGMEKEDVDKLRKTEKVRAVKLDIPVPVFVEYNSVGVDDDGRMMFYSDVYRYDRDFFAGKIPYSEEELNLLKKKIQRLY